MACIIELINPENNSSEKTLRVENRYVEAEQKAKELNEKLNSKANKKELYWKVTQINV